MHLLVTLARWFDRVVLELGREFRWSYLPPLMVYLAAGISTLVSIVGTFFVKEYLGLSAEFLAALGFWMGIPWAIKMPLGHVVDLLWRFKSWLVYLGAGLITVSLLIMIGLLSDMALMQSFLSVNAWYVISALLAPVGFVLQDVVADAMTIEAVPRLDDRGAPYPPASLKLMHTTMQTLGRVAFIGGGILVAVLNIVMFDGVQTMTETQKLLTYSSIYQLALIIPVISILGVIIGNTMIKHRYRRLLKAGVSPETASVHSLGAGPKVEPNWWILGGSLVFVVFTTLMGVNDVAYNQEIIFVGSMGIILFLMSRLYAEVEPQARSMLIGTAIIFFVYRAMPLPGAGSTWWMIDELGFDQQFFSVLQLIAASLTVAGIFLFRRLLAEKSIAYIVVWLSVASTVLALPTIGMYYGVHQWTSALTGGVVDARFIAVVDTALDSPLGQIAMIPMLAWVANSAPEHLKATFFAIMASFANLALSLGQLGTKYLNQFFVISREVKNAEGAISIPADYSDLGILLITVALFGLILPLSAVLFVRRSSFKSA